MRATPRTRERDARRIAGARRLERRGVRMEQYDMPEIKTDE